jgi:outer membrane autotransporter protein
LSHDRGGRSHRADQSKISFHNLGKGVDRFGAANRRTETVKSTNRTQSSWNDEPTGPTSRATSTRIGGSLVRRGQTWPILAAELVVLFASVCFSQALTDSENVAVGTYSATLPLYYADIQTLVDRRGELRLGFPTSNGDDPLEVWIRGFGGGLKIDNGSSRLFDQDYGGFQTGVDRHLKPLWTGELYLGVFAGYIHASRDFHDESVSRTDVFGLGAYATWVHPSGWYFDLVGKYTQMSNSFTARMSGGGAASNGDYGTSTFGGSIEFGKRVELANHRFFIEPKRN